MADPTREDVLAWMAANAKGYKAGATHFNLPKERVKKWQQRAKRAALESGGDTGGHLHVLPKPPASSPATPQGGQRGTHTRTKVSRPPTTPPGTEVSRNGRVRLTAEALDDVSAGLLRQTALRLMRYSAGEPSPEQEAALDGLTEDQLAVLRSMGFDLPKLRVLIGVASWDPRKVKDAQVALGILIDKCPDILILGKKTAEKDNNSNEDAGSDADAVAAAMGMDSG